MADSLDISCNMECNCQQEYFIPVCDQNGTSYFTACHAGCTNYTTVYDENNDETKVSC